MKYKTIFIKSISLLDTRVQSLSMLFMLVSFFMIYVTNEILKIFLI